MDKMKRVGVLLGALLLVSLSVAAQVGRGKFDVEEHDFGRIAEQGGEVSHTFHFTNVGDAPLVVQSVSTSCGCTASEWSNTPVLPGQRGSITATYNPQGRPGGFMKTISVRTNGDPSDFVLYIKGTVLARSLTPEQQYPQRYGDVGLRSSHVSVGQVWKDTSKVERLSLYNFGEREVTVRFTHLPSHVSFRPATLRLPSRSSVEVQVVIDGAKSDDWGLVMDAIRLESAGGSGDVTLVYSLEENFARLSHQEYMASARISIEPEGVDLGEVQRGVSRAGRLRISNAGQRPLQIRKVSSSCDCVVVHPLGKPIGPGEWADLGFEFRSQAAGAVNAELTVISNDPSRSVSIVKVRGVVR